MFGPFGAFDPLIAATSVFGPFASGLFVFGSFDPLIAGPLLWLPSIPSTLSVSLPDSSCNGNGGNGDGDGDLKKSSSSIANLIAGILNISSLSIGGGGGGIGYSSLLSFVEFIAAISFCAPLSKYIY